MIHEIATLDDPLLDLVVDDPVRPHIPIESRVAKNSRVLVLLDDDKTPQSVVCISFLNQIPTSEEQLFDFTAENPQIATLYTIWSLTNGGGQQMIKSGLDFIRCNYPQINRIVTLSPPTAMARRFHLKNGARELQVNESTVNFEYKL
jgi:hypothetical protein